MITRLWQTKLWPILRFSLTLAGAIAVCWLLIELSYAFPGQRP
jgi:hypothetical protein